ncbi:HlyD family efflux transporter periplasmic adaptor subunit [Microbulbifer bruguierae]|uniref:HlyD family efflux transporter periplasmic adaptor subunit n=1 Tax=Microbulbifer bruguierae TaxID=3029061 RepID=A0ABY8ND26_9GAMM|nr:HlyD family efflux transporter periplasmic adaptor subunit [Microbulbifer bruguierae]WGL16314.1 HlyD family efflux transporter periplasmic adaptor subunit [Microbulbifer bruguierae]
MQLAPPFIARMWNYNIKTLTAENSHVKKGELVVSFDDKAISERLQDRLAELQQARSEQENRLQQETRSEREDALAIEEKRAEYEKARRRAEILDHSMSRNEREKAQIDFEIASNELELAHALAKLHRKTGALNTSLAERKVQRLESETQTLQGEADKLQLYSPIDGLVQYIPNWDGEKPSQGDSVRFGQPIIQISNLSRLHVRAVADEVDKTLLTEGTPVNISIDGAHTRSLRGHISELGRVVRDRARGDRRRVIDLLVDLEPGETGLRPGMMVAMTLTDTSTELDTIEDTAHARDDGATAAVASPESAENTGKAP